MVSLCITSTVDQAANRLAAFNTGVGANYHHAIALLLMLTKTARTDPARAKRAKAKFDFRCNSLQANPTTWELPTNCFGEIQEPSMLDCS